MPGELPETYDGLITELTAEATADPQVIGLLLTGSMARGDGLPGTDIDLRYLLRGPANPSFVRSVRDEILLECGFADEPTALATLRENPMHVYAYLDGRILYDPEHGLERLRVEAEQIFNDYRIPAERKAQIAEGLTHPRDKINIALAAGDLLRACYVASTCSWFIIEGLWAAHDRPLPPNASVRPHLVDLDQPDGLLDHFERMFLAEPAVRARSALLLLEWTIDRLQR